MRECFHWGLGDATKNDEKLILDWANEKAVRQNSFNTNYINKEDHRKCEQSRPCWNILNIVTTGGHIMDITSIYDNRALGQGPGPGLGWPGLVKKPSAKTCMI